MTLILGIESSCDETAAAIVEDGRLVRSSLIASQHDLHARYGGVVPELASRAHIERISPIITDALVNAHVGFEDLDAVAVGNRPGLIGSLLVGVSAAKALAWSLGKPLIGIDHVQAHLYAPLLIDAPADASASELKPQASSLKPSPVFPALGLVVSGGHTSLYWLESPLQMKLLGRTIDDAVGEAYDKAAVILQIGYPGGPMLDKLAQSPDAAPSRFTLPRTLLGPDSLDFSYSGLKTALLYAVRGQPQGRGAAARFMRSAEDLSDADRRDLAATFQHAAIDTLIAKLHRAVEACEKNAKGLGRPATLLIGGGVSANSLLRQRVGQFATDTGLKVMIPRMAYCLDNAAMIAGLAHVALQAGQISDLHLPAIATSDVA